MPTPTLLWITAAGALIRIGCALLFVDAPGDGPTRAALGYQWLMAPRLVLDGHWLPMSEILVGLATAILPDPRWAARVLGLVAGSASIPVMGKLAGRLFGAEIGTASALLLALLPMHVGLSATMLAEPVYLFLLLSVLLAGLALDGPGRPRWALVLTVTLAAIVTGIRYEAWLIVPALGLWHLVRFRCLSCSLAFGLALSLVPLFWIMKALGGPAGLLAAFDFVAESRAAIGGEAVSWAVGMGILWGRLGQTIGPALPVLAVAGLPVCWCQKPAERLVWVAVLLGATFLALLLAVERGQSFVDRYVLTMAVLAIPLGLVAVRQVLAVPWQGMALVLVLAGSMMAANWLDPPQQYLVRRYPPETIELARWLDQNRAPDTRLLLSRMSWQASYVPLFHRLGRDEYRIISWYLSDSALRKFLARRPTLLITRDGDEAFVQRVTAAGWQLVPTPLARFGKIRVHRLQPPDG